MGGTACLETEDLTGAGDCLVREEMMVHLACLVNRGPWESQDCRDLWDRKGRRDVTLCSSHCPVLKETRVTGVCLGSLVFRVLLGAADFLG